MIQEDKQLNTATGEMSHLQRTKFREGIPILKAKR